MSDLSEISPLMTSPPTMPLPGSAETWAGAAPPRCWSSTCAAPTSTPTRRSTRGSRTPSRQPVGSSTPHGRRRAGGVHSGRVPAGRRRRRSVLREGPGAGELRARQPAGRVRGAPRPLPDETVVTKQYASAFFGTSLASTLLAARGRHGRRLRAVDQWLRACERAGCPPARVHPRRGGGRLRGPAPRGAARQPVRPLPEVRHRRRRDWRPSSACPVAEAVARRRRRSGVPSRGTAFPRVEACPRSADRHNESPVRRGGTTDARRHRRTHGEPAALRRRHRQQRPSGGAKRGRRGSFPRSADAAVEVADPAPLPSRAEHVTTLSEAVLLGLVVPERFGGLGG